MIDGVQEVHPKPEEAAKMPYAPAISVEGGADIIFLSGSTASPLYHQHPHVPEEHVLPHAIEDQTRLLMENIKSVLDARGLTWRNVVKVTKYMTDMRDREGMHTVLDEYFGEWRPASTMICINCLSAPGARIELDMIAVAPKS